MHCVIKACFFSFLPFLISCSSLEEGSSLNDSGNDEARPGLGFGSPTASPIPEGPSFPDASEEIESDAAEAEDVGEVQEDGGDATEGAGGSDVEVSDEDTADFADVADAAEPDPIETWNIDVSDVECLYVPASAAFAPILECQWSGSLEYPLHDDVVMTPAVANLTDDDLDGDVDLEDTPDVVFVSYRYQEDGCCTGDSVLRIVSGSCSAGTSTITTQDNELPEHVSIGEPALDNSGGIALGDIDQDGEMEIVAMKRNAGMVAFSGVRYPIMIPSEPVNVSNWEPSGTASHVEAVAVNDGDGMTVSTATPGSVLLLKGLFAESPVALAGLRVKVTAKTDGLSGKVSAFLAYGEGYEVESNALTVAGAEFSELRFVFPRNESSGESRQWQLSDLSDLNFGIVHRGAEGVALQVTEVVVEVGSVFVEWDSEYPKAEDTIIGAQPAIVDVNQDGVAEVLLGRTLVSGTTGDVIWTGTAGVGLNGFIGPISFAADVDLDGVQEVIAGDTLYDSQGEVIWQVVYDPDALPCQKVNLPCDGFNAVGNFDSDPEGEIVTVFLGSVYVLEHTGELKAKREIPKSDCPKNEGGPPTIADFDNDGFAEVGVAGADYYVVVDWQCCTDPLNCDTIPADMESECEEAGIRWKAANQDCSSRVTGSSVFDFEGDGAAEVIYNDEKYFRIFDGASGTVLFEVENSSHTRLEYPVIVDSDRDGNAEIVIVENTTGSTPLQIWGDVLDNWVPTRTIWNQHAYHISNISEDGSLPAPGSPPSWSTHNTFRQNLPDFDPFLAPDLQADWLSADLSECPDTISLEGKVCNGGQLWISGVDVRVFDADGQEIVCEGGIQMDKNLEAGECTKVVCRVEDASVMVQAGEIILCADDYVASCVGPGWSNECDETNNSSTSQAPICPTL